MHLVKVGKTFSLVTKNQRRFGLRCREGLKKTKTATNNYFDHGLIRQLFLRFLRYVKKTVKNAYHSFSEANAMSLNCFFTPSNS